MITLNPKKPFIVEVRLDDGADAFNSNHFVLNMQRDELDQHKLWDFQGVTYGKTKNHPSEEDIISAIKVYAYSVITLDDMSAFIRKFHLHQLMISMVDWDFMAVINPNDEYMALIFVHGMNFNEFKQAVENV